MAKRNPFEEQAELQKIPPRGRTPKVHNANSQTPSRVGKVGVTLYFNVDAHRLLKELAMDHQTSITAILMEGTNLALQNYGKKPIA